MELNSKVKAALIKMDFVRKYEELHLTHLWHLI